MSARKDRAEAARLTPAQKATDVEWRDLCKAARDGNDAARRALILADMPTDGDSLFSYVRGYGGGR